MSRYAVIRGKKENVHFTSLNSDFFQRSELQFDSNSYKRPGFNFTDNASASPPTKNTCEMIHGIKTEETDALLANVCVAFRSRWLKLFSTVVLLHCLCSAYLCYLVEICYCCVIKD